MIFELDGSLMTDRKSAHEHLKTRLALPDYYGSNLDALYDLLTEWGNPARIILKNRDAMITYMGGYADVLTQTLAEAADNNPALEFEVI